MRDISNEERLRILRERLEQIQQKNGNTPPSVFQKEEKAETIIDTPNNNDIPSSKRRNKLPLLFLIAILLYTSYYIYTNITPPNQNAVEELTEETKEEETEELTEEVTEEIALKYTLNFGKKKHLIIANSFVNEESAKSFLDNKIKDGYTADYFFLPDVSNSLDKIYQVYIGPFSTLEETNQWSSTLEGEFEILIL